MSSYDVIVVGGGISGACAAISAGMAGLKVLLIERLGFLGGMLTASGVAPMMTFHAGETQVVQGVPEMVVRRLVGQNLSPGHIFDTTGYTYTVTPFDLEGLKVVLEDMVHEAGGNILYNTMLAKVHVEAGKITSIEVCNKAGMVSHTAPVYIDATGDGDLSAWAGVPFTFGRESDGKSQALSMMLRVNNVDVGKTREYILAHDEEFPRLEGDLHKIDRADRLSIGGFVKTLQKAMDAKELSFERDDVLFFETNSPGEVVINMSRMMGYDPTDPWQLGAAETLGRKQARELMAFMKNHIPGFENAKLMFTGPFVGVRASRQICGVYRLTDEDLVECRTFPDSVAYSGYPADVHEPVQAGNLDKEIRHKAENKVLWGKIKSLPYRCLINETVTNVITVGRCVSVSFKAQGSFRTAPIAAAIGHAGGAAAALTVRKGTTAPGVNTDELRELLKEQQAFIL